MVSTVIDWERAMVAVKEQLLENVHVVSRVNIDKLHVEHPETLSL